MSLEPDIVEKRDPVLKVLGRASSSNVQKVMWCLAELGVACERIDIGGAFGGTSDASFLKLNPNGLVPTLVDGDTVVWESNTIVRYLCNRFAPTPLYPADAAARADIERWMDWQLGTLNGSLTPLFLALVRTPAELRQPDSIEQHRSRTGAMLSLLDGALRGRDFLCGNRLTLAEIGLGASIYRWFELPIERASLPSLARWYTLLQQRPGYRQQVMIGLA